MTQRLYSHVKILAIILAFIGAMPMKAIAEVPFPTIHEPEGVECVEPEDEMRRHHMDYILHQRDKTVHEGVRTKKYSFAVCIDCHVQPDENGNIASFESDEHFCSTCHNYASVQIDCFECHADRPQKYIKRGKKTALKQQLHEILAAHGEHK